MKKRFQHSASIFIEALFPAACYGCGKAKTYLCAECLTAVAHFRQPVCPHCETRLPHGATAPVCKKELLLDRIFAPGTYQDRALRALIHDLKYKNARVLARSLSSFLSWWFQQYEYAPQIPPDTIVVPVPGHSLATRKRGFNHAEKIAEEFSSAQTLKISPDVLRKHKKTKAQAKTENARERKQNVQGVFSVTDKDLVRGKTVLLIDDVITTGSTVRECAKVLRGAGAQSIIGVAVAQN